LESRKLKIVIKNHDCERVGELTSFKSFDAVSKINDTGNARLVAGYDGYNDEILDSLDTADMILECYIQPPGHSGFLDNPVWSGFLRDRKIQVVDNARIGTYEFKDFNHLLERRLVIPPDGGSHDEEYGLATNVMRRLVRKHAAEDAEPQRQLEGLSVESDDEETIPNIYIEDTSALVFGSNMPSWVRINTLLTWNGWMYAGTETRRPDGVYAAIYRTADGLTWEQVFIGSPGTYASGITSINCLAEFDGQLWAGCTQEWGDSPPIVIRSTDGVSWTREREFANDEGGVWALASFDGSLFAGTTGYGTGDATTYIWKSDDGEAWTSVATTNDTLFFGGPFVHRYYKACYSLYEWDGHLYAGLVYKRFFSLGIGVRDYNKKWARAERSNDGTTWNQVFTASNYASEGVLSFIEFDGRLYLGTGRTRYTTFFWFSNVEFAMGGQIWRSSNGTTWAQVFGGSQKSGAISDFLVTTDDDGDSVLWAASGWRRGGWAQVFQSSNGSTWNSIAEITTVPYAWLLSFAELLGNRFVSTGSYDKGGERKPDYGDVWRVVPADSDIGNTGAVGRWATLLEKLKDIAEESGNTDFRIVGYDSFIYCPQSFEFQVRTPQWGTDNSWDGENGVSFALERSNMTSPVYQDLRGSRPNMVYVLGPSADTERIVEEYYLTTTWTEESPWARIEGSVNAQSVDSAPARGNMGLAQLELNGPRVEFDFEILETDTVHYVGENIDNEHPMSFNLGDIVTAWFDA